MTSSRQQATLLTRLRRDAVAVLDLLKQKNSCVEVFLLPNSEMRRLKWEHLKKRKKIVDVLAFPEPAGFPQPQSKKKLLGQIYLNGESFESTRLQFLLVHGILHLLGYRHEKKRDIIEMESLEDEVVAALASRKRAQRV